MKKSYIERNQSCHGVTLIGYLILRWENFKTIKNCYKKLKKCHFNLHLRTQNLGFRGTQTHHYLYIPEKPYFAILPVCAVYIVIYRGPALMTQYPLGRGF